MSKQAWGEGNVYLRGTTYWIVYSVNGHRVRESTGTGDERKARQTLRKRLTAAQGGDVAPTKTTVDALLDNLLDFYRKHRPKSKDWAEIVVKHLRAHQQGKFKYRRAADVGTRSIKEYIDARHKQGVGNATINRELALLHRAFVLGQQHEPPLVRTAFHYEKLPENPPRAGFFEREDFERLCRHLPPEVADVARFAYWTGMRRGEILSLKWSQVDLSARLLTLNPGTTKSGEGRTVPMATELADMLSRRHAERQRDFPWSPWVFSRNGLRILDFKAAWAVAVKSAGLNEARLLHDMRRTAVRNLRHAGVAEKVIMAITGHKTRSTFERYNIVQPDDLRVAVERMEKHIKGGQ